MDYGDEMNDEEERRYKKEMYGDSQEEEGEEDGEFEQSESDES
jgi:hypothetical protein